jgi:hypothetical protein
VFFPLQVTVVLTASREGKGRRKQGRSAHFRSLSAAACVPTHRSGDGAWGDAPLLFSQFHKSVWHCSVGGEGYPCNFRLFWG